MEKLKELTSIASILGEENEKRLKDGITDLLLRQVDMDISDKYEYDYILVFDDIYAEVKAKIEEEFKEKLTKKYRKLMNKRMNDVLGE